MTTERTLAAAHNLASSLRLVGDYFAARHLDQETLDRRGRARPRPSLHAALGSKPGPGHACRWCVPGLRGVAAGHLGEVSGGARRRDARDAAHSREPGSVAAQGRRAGRGHEPGAGDLRPLQRRYGTESPDAQSCALNLACDYAAVDDMPEALNLVTEVMAALQATLGDDHPNTMVAANNLACYLRAIGRLPEALALAEDTLRRMRGGSVIVHPLTLSAAVNLANCQGDSGNLAAAEALERETISRLREVLGTIIRISSSARPIWRSRCATPGATRKPGTRGPILGDFSRVLGPVIRTPPSFGKASGSTGTWNPSSTDRTAAQRAQAAPPEADRRQDCAGCWADSQRRMSGSTSRAPKWAAPAWTTTAAVGIRSASQRAWLTGDRLSLAPCQSRTGTVTVAGSNPHGEEKASASSIQPCADAAVLRHRSPAA